ncbi:MAG: hypothetical protein JSW01_04275 [Candidatus Bathyarchaeota archaeon]|nr:MAG: hypothetical protein JSW01_04275 [Candidatus Bathyarchaeota archaeon]
MFFQINLAHYAGYFDLYTTNPLNSIVVNLESHKGIVGLGLRYIFVALYRKGGKVILPFFLLATAILFQ